MKWNKITLSTTIYATELISAMLMDLGINGIEIVDNIPLTNQDKEAMFIDILPDLDEKDEVAKISFYLDWDENFKEVIDKIKEGLKDIEDFVDVGSGHIEITQTKDEDWINNWKEHFKPFRVTDHIVIKPTWETLKEVDDTDIIIEIDPGTAFGTGSHETTKLCIIELQKYLKADNKILDIGCGSGILSIISKKLGAGKVHGIDIDSNAVNTAIDNAKVNNLSQNDVTFFQGNLLESSKKLEEDLESNGYDLVVANIFADIIMPLSALVGKYLKAGGYFISSGIIKRRSREVQETMKNNGFEIIDVNTMGDWVSIIACQKI